MLCLQCELGQGICGKYIGEFLIPKQKIIEKLQELDRTQDIVVGKTNTDVDIYLERANCINSMLQRNKFSNNTQIK